MYSVYYHSRICFIRNEFNSERIKDIFLIIVIIIFFFRFLLRLTRDFTYLFLVYKDKKNSKSTQ